MSKRKTHEQFISELGAINPNIEVLERYVNYHTKILCRCLIDNYEWRVEPAKLISSKHGCPKCGRSLKLTQEEFEKQLHQINPDIEIVGNLKNVNTKIQIRCKVCGKEWGATPSHLKSGEGCPSCAIKRARDRYRKSLEEFKREMEKIDSTIEIIDDKYLSNKDKIKCKCKVCNKEWSASPTNLLKERGCPSCTSSKGEKKVQEWLKKSRIRYETEFTFDECKDKRKMPFDFYLPDYNMVIEYDGQQHFYPTRFGGISQERAEHNFKEVKRRDELKNLFCEEVGIKLLRISYLQYNEIEDILEKHIII